MKDAFNMLLKAEHHHVVLTNYGKLEMELSQAKENLEFEKKIYTKITIKNDFLRP